MWKKFKHGQETFRKNVSIENIEAEREIVVPKQAKTNETEKIPATCQKNSATKIQSAMRGWKERKRHEKRKRR